MPVPVTVWLALTAILTARHGGNAEVCMCMVLASVPEYAERERAAAVGSSCSSRVTHGNSWWEHREQQGFIRNPGKHRSRRFISFLG